MYFGGMGTPPPSPENLTTHPHPQEQPVGNRVKDRHRSLPAPHALKQMASPAPAPVPTAAVLPVSVPAGGGSGYADLTSEQLCEIIHRATAELRLRAQREQVSSVPIEDVDAGSCSWCRCRRCRCCTEEVPAGSSGSRRPSQLRRILTAGEIFTLNSNSLCWEVVWTGEAFRTPDGRLHRSPGAVCRAHAHTIYDGHPRPTNPGSGYVHLKRASDGKTLGDIYDEAVTSTGS